MIGFVLIKFIIFPLAFKKHKSQLPCIVSPLMFGKLRSKELFLNINRCLKDGGVVVAQASGYQKETLSTFKKYFTKSYGWPDNFNLEQANSFVYGIK